MTGPRYLPLGVITGGNVMSKEMRTPSGRLGALRAVGAALIAVTAIAIVLSGCSGGASEAELSKAAAMGADAQVQKDSLKHQQDVQASLQADVKRLEDDAAKAAAAKAATERAAKAKAAAAQSQKTSCGGNVTVGANTTCAFALNVESMYYQNGGGDSTFDVYSPVTGLYYTMTCTPGIPTVCRGGNNAVIYIR